ncbi:hypothetical protein BGX38DRAFT_1229227 [Terfezia claveryi]|nr:hypothetical protein BGX38DRAFT_1229227 [Terfezia claveryi]
MLRLALLFSNLYKRTNLKLIHLLQFALSLDIPMGQCSYAGAELGMLSFRVIARRIWMPSGNRVTGGHSFSHWPMGVLDALAHFSK